MKLLLLHHPCFINRSTPSFQVLVPKRIFSSKMLDFRRAKFHIFSTISIVAICFVFIFADSFISNLSLHSVALNTDHQPEPHSHNTRLVLESVSIAVPIKQSPKEEVSDRENYIEDYGNMVPPINVTTQQRIAWFKKELQKFEIFKSTPLSLQFENRVEEFFGDDRCKIQFFMTWIAPASSFGEREFLAMESLFKTNPHGCLIIMSRTMDSVRGLRILNPLIDRGFKVVAVTPDLASLFKNTPAESWFNEMKSGNNDPGEIPLAQNLSNLIRLAVLYKYGGVYLDTDFIVLKDFSGLRNSIGAQSVDLLGNWTRLNNAVLVFDKKHPLVYKFIEEFALTFNGNKWGHNGPYLVSRVVAGVATRKDYNFAVLPPMAFYPVHWGQVGGFFTRPVDLVRSKWVEAKLLQLSGGTYGVHLWNKQSSGLRIEKGSIMERLISEHCIICKHAYSS